MYGYWIKFNETITSTSFRSFHGEGGQTGGNNSFYYIDEDLAKAQELSKYPRE